MTEYYGYIKGCSYTGFLLLIFAGLYGSLLCKKKIKRGKHLKLDLNNISHPRSPKLGPSLSPKIIRKNSLVDIEIETVLTNE